MDYTKFEKLIRTMESTGYNYKKEYEWTLQSVKEKNMKMWTFYPTNKRRNSL